MKEQKYALRLPVDLYDKVSDYAKSDHRSMNSVIILALNNFLGLSDNNNLESKHILGSVVLKSALHENGLVEIKGLIYHYLFFDENSDLKDSYTVVYVSGNKVLLK